MPIPDRESPLERAQVEIDRFAEPSGKARGRLMMARDNKETVAVNDVVYIDLGGEDNVAPGNYLTTGIITRSLSGAHTGDWVEIQ